MKDKDNAITHTPTYGANLSPFEIHKIEFR